MIDFGVGSFFHEVEKRIGARWAKACTFVAMAAFAAFCISAIWTYFAGPVFFAIAELYNGQASLVDAVWEVLKRVIWFCLVIFATTNMMNVAAIARARKDAEALFDRVDALNRDLESRRPHFAKSVQMAESQEASFRAVSVMMQKLVELDKETKSKAVKAEIRKIAQVVSADIDTLEALHTEASNAADAVAEGVKDITLSPLGAKASAKSKRY